VCSIMRPCHAHVKSVTDTTQENASTTQAQPLVIYIEDAQTVTRDKCR